jgi:hypothetical protein
MFSKADWIEAAVKVAMKAWKATRRRLMFFL